MYKQKSNCILSILLALMMILSINSISLAAETEATTGLENFTKTNTYIDGQFLDVRNSDWFAENVANAYEYGLVKGSSATTFNPTGKLTVAETIVLACRLHNIYNGGDGNFTQGSPWYQVYVDYANENGIISGGYSYDSAITRFSFVNILSNALPKEALNEINIIESGKIPDVVENTINEPIYLFYRVGILTGSDKYGTFNPNSNIQRSEVAAIVTRMADATQRKTFQLEEKVWVPESIEISGGTAISVGDSVVWNATISPSKANQWVQWISGNPAVATVASNGYIEGLKAGQSNITAIASNGIKKTMLLTVKEKGGANSKYNINVIGVGQTYRMQLKEYAYGGVKYHAGCESLLSSADYIITNYPNTDKINIEVKIVLIPLEYGVSSIHANNNTISVKAELYDSNNRCVETRDILISDTTLGQAYSHSFNFFVDADNYTLNFKNLER